MIHGKRWWVGTLLWATLASQTHAQTPEVTIQEVFQKDHSHKRPATAPDALIVTRTDLPPSGPVHLVVFFHGWSGCVHVLAGSGGATCVAGAPTEQGWGLGAVVGTLPPNTVLLMPQLAWKKRDGTPGKFTRPEFAKAFVQGALADAGLAKRPLASVTLVAHSAGYEAALAFLRDGVMPVTRVVLFDALYADGAAFGRWVTEAKGRQVLSFFTGNASTYHESKLLYRIGRRRLGNATTHQARDGATADFSAYRVLIGRVPYKHAEIPARMLGPVMIALLAAPRPK